MHVQLNSTQQENLDACVRHLYVRINIIEEITKQYYFTVI